MLDDGSECKKEIHSIGFFFPPVPLSGEMDPSVDPSTKSRQAAGKGGSKQDKLAPLDPSGMMLYHRRDAAKIYAPQCGSHLFDKRSSTTTS